MDINSFVLYADVTEVYDKLISFCSVNGFTVKEIEKKYFSITAKKISILFWQRLQIELKITAVEKKKVEVNVMIHKYGRRRPDLEMKYRMAIDAFFSSR